MSRVNPTEVKVIITTSLTDPAIQTWIDVANTIINNKINCIGSDEVLLTQIELQLSAHFVGMEDPEIRGFITKESISGEFETTYSNPIKLTNTIDNTRYGIAANMLSNGCLSEISDKPIFFASVGSIGDDNGC